MRFGSKLQKTKTPNNNLTKVVDKKEILETKTDLGYILEDDISWTSQLQGESWKTEDNAKELSQEVFQRLEILQKLAKYTTGENICKFIDGIL